MLHFFVDTKVVFGKGLNNDFCQDRAFHRAAHFLRAADMLQYSGMPPGNFMRKSIVKKINS